MNRQALRAQLASMLCTATGGEVPVSEALADGASLTDLGVGSLEFLRLIDAIEAEYGIDIGLEDRPAVPDTVDALADHLVRHGLRLADG